jgi:hypothetical protein
MSDLTIENLKEKLKIIDQDLETLRSMGDSGRKLGVLTEYRDYIKDEIKFLPPIEFYGLVKIEEPKNSTYNKGVNRYLEPGNMVLSVYLKHLEELQVDIRYGDYIGYPESEEKIRYYTVTNDGKVTSDNKHNMFGYKPYYRTITCVPTQESEFRGV